MTLEEAVVARLRAAAAVTALVGSGNTARIYWLVRPQGGALPAVVLTVSSEDRDQHLDGDNDMIETVVQADSWATSQAQASALDAAVRAALMPPADQGGMLFWRASDEGRTTTGEQTTEGYLRRVIRYVRLRHTAG